MVLEYLPQPIAVLTDIVTGENYALHLGEQTIGRRSADILAPDGTVSRVHARLCVSYEGITVEDLGSSNGTFVNGRRLFVNHVTPISPGQMLAFGSWQVAVALSAEVAVPAAPHAFDVRHSGRRRAGYLARVSDNREAFVLYSGTNRIGRVADENDVVVSNDPMVSTRHAEVLAYEDGIYISDMGSSNGTMLNGKKLVAYDPRPLSDGDVIRIGKVELRYTVAAPAEMRVESPGAV